MKVVEKRKLLAKDAKGFFVNNDNYTLLRTRAVIQDEVVEESKHSYKETGIIWVVDEKATKEWLEAKQPKKQSEVLELEFEGLKITEDNLDDFIKDNDIDLGRTSTVQGKLSKVEKWIKEQNK
jgi:hypothetical protein